MSSFFRLGYVEMLSLLLYQIVSTATMHQVDFCPLHYFVRNKQAIDLCVCWECP
jgi:hypothetical protein